MAFFWGGNGRDVLIGNNGPDSGDWMSGGNGRDLIFGGWGKDSRDTLIGNNGADLLIGWSGDDRFYGGNGADIMTMVFGNNWAWGGKGPDTFVFDARQWLVEDEPNDTVSVIYDYDPKQDTLHFYGADEAGIRYVDTGRDVIVTNQFGNEIVKLINVDLDDVVDAGYETGLVGGVGIDSMIDWFMS